MAIYKVFSILDTKAGVFSTPFFQVNDAVAVRSFKDAVNDPTHTFYRNAEDYELHRLGDFDDSTGLVECDQEVASGRVFICNAMQVRNKEAK